jgi:hypothetical protein
MVSEDLAKTEQSENSDKSEKIETCYICNKKFDINADDLSHYHYDKYPMCDYCSDFYRFYR